VNELEQQIQALEEEAATYRRQGNDTKYNEKITEANQLRQQLEAMQSEQAKSELSDGLVQQIQEYDIFGALFPESDFVEILGLTVYNEKRQEMNKIIHGYSVLIQTPLLDKQTAERQDFTAQIRQLKDMNFKQEEEIAEYDAQLESLKVDTDMVIDDLKNKLAAKDAEIANLNEQLVLKQTHIDQLRIDLANAPAPKAAIDVTPVSNQAFADMLAETKAKSIKSAAELALSGSTFRGKVIVSADGQTPLTSSITPPPVGGSESADSFRGEDTQANIADTGSVVTEVASGSVEETPTLEQRVAALEQAVFGKVKAA
jgi:hypothetical protein